MTSIPTKGIEHNRLLALLTVPELTRLSAQLEPVSLRAGDPVIEAGEVSPFVFFPLDCVLSVLEAGEEGNCSELAMVGNDGLAGLEVLLEGQTSPWRIVVQASGQAMRLRTEWMEWELRQGGRLRQLALRYAQTLMTHMGQNIVCSRDHALDQRFCRWLLNAHELLDGREMDLTHESMSNLLGVRRESITEAMGRLQSAGLISSRRGHLSVLDIGGLRARACACHRIVAQESNRLQMLSNRQAGSDDEDALGEEGLRERAERLWKQLKKETVAGTALADRELYELEVHQIELEMQNEELQEAYAAADAARARYADLYDFSVVAFLTLNVGGAITQSNLAAAMLLCVPRSSISRYRFGAFVKQEDLGTFNRFLEGAFSNQNRHKCELSLVATERRGEIRVIIEANSNESLDECRMVIVDVTAERAAEEALRQQTQQLRTFIDGLPFMAWLKDGQGRYLAGNAALAENLAVDSPASLVGKSLYEIRSPRGVSEADIAEDEAVLHGSRKLHLERVVLIGGEPRRFEIYKAPIVLPGRTLGTVGYARDVSVTYGESASEMLGVGEEYGLTALTVSEDLQELERTREGLRNGVYSHATVLTIVINHLNVFKATCGPAALKALLRQFASVLRDNLGETDIVSARDGEEFVVILIESDLEAAWRWSERFLEILSSIPVLRDTMGFTLSVSVSMSAISSEDEEAAISLEQARKFPQLTMARRLDPP